MSLSSPSILERSHAFPFLSLLQSQVDSLVGGFAEQATDWKSLAAMTAGGLAYRFGRVGAMAAGTRRLVSAGIGLGLEASAFEMTNRSLASLSGEGTFQSNLWRWEGQGGIRQGLLSSLVTFGTLKGAGRLAQGENVVVQHLLQDTGMVLGHQVSASFGIKDRPQGTLAEQFLHAEATNLQLGAGMALAHSVAPGTQGLERGLDLSLRFSDPTEEKFPSGQPPDYIEGEGHPFFSFQMMGRGGIGKIGTKTDTIRPQFILMSSGMRDRDKNDQSEPPATSDMRPKPLPREESAISGTFPYPPIPIGEVEARYRMVVESATDGIITVGEDGRILSVNPAMQRIFGYESGELLGKPLTLLMPPEVVSHHSAAFDRYLATGRRTFSWESVPLTGRRKDGQDVFLEISYSDFVEGGHRTFTAVMRDVTEKRKAEEALQEFVDRNEALLQAMPYKFYRVHRDGTILDVRSNQSEDLLHPPDMLIGLNVRDLPLPPALREITQTTLPKALETGEIQIVDYLFPHPDGRNLFQRARILKSGPDEVVWITEDTTESKREEAIRLEREKHETLLLVGRGLAHDINNALASGMPCLNFIKEGIQNLLSGSLTQIDASTEDVNQILEDMGALEISLNRIQGMTTEFGELTGNPAIRVPVDLHSLVQKRTLRTYLGPEIQLRLRTEPNPFSIWGNPDGLARVIENLVKNAREAMEDRPDPTLTVETQGIDLTPENLKRLLPLPETGVGPGRFMRLRVQDTGEGMDEETLHQLFQPYFSTKTKSPSQQGHRGVGLAISRKLIRDLGGFITVKSEPGEGTVFDLYLPEAAEDTGKRRLRRRVVYPPPTLPPLSTAPEESPPESR